MIRRKYSENGKSGLVGLAIAIAIKYFEMVVFDFGYDILAFTKPIYFEPFVKEVGPWIAAGGGGAAWWRSRASGAEVEALESQPNVAPQTPISPPFAGAGATPSTAVVPEAEINQQAARTAQSETQQQRGAAVASQDPYDKPLSVAPKTYNWRYGKRSEETLSRAHPDLQVVARRALQLSPLDIAITESTRTLERQRELIEQGRSWTLKSRHLQKPSLAIDHAAYNDDGLVTWDMAAYVTTTNAFKMAAKELGIPIKCGIDWKQKDGPHVELSRDIYPDAEPDIQLA